MLTPDIIYLAIAIGSTAFAIFLFFRRPQEKGETNDAVFVVEIRSLAERFDTRFADMKDGVVKVMQNDLQEVKSDIREHVRNQIVNEREVSAKLASISVLLDERLPKK
jgi:archaellum biogenesis protein FlaJ (TadC family)